MMRAAQRFCCALICFASAILSTTAAQADSATDIRILMDQLNDVRAVRRGTVEQILQIAKKDPQAREYVVQRLPDLIRKPESDVWLDAIRIAGSLKAKEAIPALQEVMSRRPLPAKTYLTLAGIENLDNDIVAKALSQIGNPAIPSVRTLLASGDSSMRSRAVLILRNIGSPAARKALQEYLPHETNQEVRKLIQDSLRS
jgi:hypothetical protein